MSSQVAITQDLQFPATQFGSSQNFLSNSCSKIVILLHCNNMQFSGYLIISKMQIKHDYYPFPLVLSPTFGQLGRPLPEEPFFTLSNVTVFNMFLCSLCFSKLPLSFLFPFSGVDLQ